MVSYHTLSQADRRLAIAKRNIKIVIVDSIVTPYILINGSSIYETLNIAISLCIVYSIRL